jgi:hypothetical protein
MKNEEKKEIDKFLKAEVRIKDLHADQLKAYPAIAAFYKGVQAKFEAGEITLGELANCYSYGAGDVIEAVFGDEAYEYYRSFGPSILL